MSLIIRVTSADNSKVYTQKLEGNEARIALPEDAKIAIVDEVSGQVVPVIPRITYNEDGEQLIAFSAEHDGEEIAIVVESEMAWPAEAQIDIAEGLETSEMLAASDEVVAEREGSIAERAEAFGAGFGVLPWVVIGALGIGGIIIAATDDDNTPPPPPPPPPPPAGDTTAPDAPENIDLAAVDDSGVSDSDNITSQTNGLTITGTAEANSDIEVFVDGTSVVTSTADGDGNFTVDLALSEGANGITVTATDAAGNISAASTALNVTVDMTIAAPSGLDLLAADDDGASNTDNVVSTGENLTISGVAEAGSTVTLSAGAAVVGTAVADASGAFTADVTLPAGSNEVTATATDIAGNTSAASAALSITVDDTAPAAPTNLRLDPADDDGSSSTDGVTDRRDDLTILGSAVPGSTVEIFADGDSLGTTTADANGHFSFTDDAEESGTFEITAVAIDQFGRASDPSEALTLSVGQPPQLLNTSIDGAGDVVTLYFDERLDESLADDIADGFVITNFGTTPATSVDVLGADINGNRITLYLAEPISAENGPAVSFTGAIADVTGNELSQIFFTDITNDISADPSGGLTFVQKGHIELDGAEIVAFDPESSRLFVTSGDGLQVLSVDANLNFELLGIVELGTNNVTSVAVKNGLVAVAVVADPSTDPGTVFLLDAGADVGTGMVLNSITVGSLPDMVTFTPDGNTVLVANEGESTTLDDVEEGADYVNPEGSVSLIDVSGGAAAASVQTAGFAAFNDRIDDLRAEGVRLFAGLGDLEDITVAQDVEPEYIAVSPDGKTALITLQEANAVAVLDIASATIIDIQPLGLKPWQDLPADFSDRDGGINLVDTIENSPTAMLQGQNGFVAQEIFTVGESLPSDGDDYTPVGVLDGLGAFELDGDTVRVFANHELTFFDGNTYELGNGAELTGARISFFDIDKGSLEIVDSGLAYHTVYNAAGEVYDGTNTLNSTGGGFSRFCSANLFEADTFGAGNGLVDTIFFTGEEDGGFFNPIGGNEWALDAETGEIWAIPFMGHGAWENITQVDTGTTTHVAFILADDSSPFNFDDDERLESAPLYLYVGEKDTSEGASFLGRNGLDGGDLFVWVPDAGADADTPSEFTGTGNSQAGTWVQIDNAPNLGEASEDGSSGFDEFGFPTQGNLWNQAEEAGAFQFSRPEDVATNPHDGSEFVLASTGREDDFDGDDLVGEIYTMDIVFDFDGEGNFNGATGDLNVLYDGDSDPSQTLRSPDNLDWADDGLIYVQEDRAVGGIFGDGAVNPNEAGIVRLDPAVEGGNPQRIANIDPSVTLPVGAVEENLFFNGQYDVGDWESSGILDVSSLFGAEPGSLFLSTVQAHGIDDQGRFEATEGTLAERLTDDDLKEGGQLLFLGQPELLQRDNDGVYGQYMPDSIASFTGGDGKTYYVIANEGDARDDFIDDVDGRGDDLDLDPTIFPDAGWIQRDDILGRLEVTTFEGLNGDTDNDGDVDKILAYGARSFSILDENGNIIYDSGSHIEEFVATGGLFDEDDAITGLFDDGRSDAKGPEPEGITTGVYGDHVLAFVALERGGGGVMVYDVTDPTEVEFVTYMRDLRDIAPEGLIYIPAADSPSGKPVLVVASEETSTLTGFEIAPAETYTLQLLHFADAELKSLGIETAPNLAALVDAFEDLSSNSITLAGGDNYIPGLFFTAQNADAVEETLGFNGGPKVDIAIHNAIGVQASTIGNHEFDKGTGTFASAIAASGAYDGALFPYLSANLDFSGDASLNALFQETLGVGGLELASELSNSIVPSAVIEEGGELIGLVGATTQVLSTITSLGNVEVKGPDSNDMAALAAILQPYIDDLVDQGVNKIVLMSHLQQLELEIALAPMLEGVDIILGAGSNTLLSDENDELVAFPGHPATSQGDYPIVTQGADGATTVIVNTDNEYTYLGRLVVDFDAEGNIIAESLEDYTFVNGAYAATAENVAAAWGVDVEDLDDTAFGEGTRGAEVQELIDAVNEVLLDQGSNVYGYSDVYLEGARVPGVRTEETNLGDLTADANAYAAREALGLDNDEVVVSFKNGGGIRDSIGALDTDYDTGLTFFGPNEGGVITQLDVGAVLAFNNGLIVFDTTPQGLLNILNSPNVFQAANGGFGQVSGLQVSYDPDAPQGDRVIDIALVDGNGDKIALVDDGEVVDGAPSTITMVTLDFIAANDGDGTEIAENGTNFRYITVDAEGNLDVSGALGTLDQGGGDLVVNTGAFVSEGGEQKLGEQQALAEYLGEFHGTLEEAFDQEDTPQAFDERIQNVDAREDTVLDGAELVMELSIAPTDLLGFERMTFEDTFA